jgi:uncharacterized coiled-coil protein SlyX
MSDLSRTCASLFNFFSISSIALDMAQTGSPVSPEGYTPPLPGCKAGLISACLLAVFLQPSYHVPCMQTSHSSPANGSNIVSMLLSRLAAVEHTIGTFHTTPYPAPTPLQHIPHIHPHLTEASALEVLPPQRVDAGVLQLEDAGDVECRADHVVAACAVHAQALATYSDDRTELAEHGRCVDTITEACGEHAREAEVHLASGAGEAPLAVQVKCLSAMCAAQAEAMEKLSGDRKGLAELGTRVDAVAELCAAHQQVLDERSDGNKGLIGIAERLDAISAVCAQQSEDLNLLQWVPRVGLDELGARMEALEGQCAEQQDTSWDILQRRCDSSKGMAELVARVDGIAGACSAQAEALDAFTADGEMLVNLAARLDAIERALHEASTFSSQRNGNKGAFSEVWAHMHAIEAACAAQAEALIGLTSDQEGPEMEARLAGLEEAYAAQAVALDATTTLVERQQVRDDVLCTLQEMARQVEDIRWDVDTLLNSPAQQAKDWTQGMQSPGGAQPHQVKECPQGVDALIGQQLLHDIEQQANEGVNTVRGLLACLRARAHAT